MKYLILILSFFVFYSVLAEDKKIILGEFSWNQWKSESGWKKIDSCFESFPLNLDTIKFIKEKLVGDINIEIFAGSWCGDSESELPKIMKLFELINFKNYKIFGVDRDKLTPNMYSKFRNIEKVPTLIIIRKFDEIGRIIEFPDNPSKNWEEQILKIIP